MTLPKIVFLCCRMRFSILCSCLPVLFFGAVPALAQDGSPVEMPERGDQVTEEQAAEPVPVSLALVGGLVHTMEADGEPIAATVLIAGDRIAAVGPELEIPAGVEVVDVSGKHILPGLIDAMVGFDPDHDALYLRAGITLVRDIGTARVRNLALRDTEVRDSAPGPALLAPGAPLDGDPPSSPEAAILRDVSATDVLLPIVVAEHPDYLSILQGLGPDVHARVLEFAAEAKLPVWGPVPRALTLEQALAQGQRGFYFLDSLLPPEQDWVQLGRERAQSMAGALGQAGARLVPALEASAVRLVDPRQEQSTLEALALLAPSYGLWWMKEAEGRAPLLSEEVLSRGRAQQKAAQAFLRAAVSAGVQLVPGSGAPNPWLFPGNSLHAELERWVEAGLTPDTVLQLATRGAAEALEQGQERGQIRPGFSADLLVVPKDPRQDLSVLVDPEIVVLRGRVLTRETLEQAVQAVLEARNQERSLLNAPIPVEEAPLTEGATVVLRGHIENWAVGQRVAAEKFHVERLPDGLTRYVSRIVEPGRQGIPAREMLVRQDIREGELVEFTVQATDGEHQLIVEGIWTAETMRIRRVLDGLNQDGVLSTGEHIRAVDAGSATTFLILAQKPRPRDFPMLALHEGLGPEVVNWDLRITPAGDFQLGTPTGPIAFRLDERGAPTRSRRVIGRGTLDGNLLEADTGGGPGLPLPEETRAWVQEQAELARASQETQADGGDAATNAPASGAKSESTDKEQKKDQKEEGQGKKGTTEDG